MILGIYQTGVYKKHLFRFKTYIGECLFMGIHAFFRGFNDLERIERMPGKFKYESHNVAAHSWKVSQYAQFLATVEEQNGTDINWKKLFEITTNHDYSERFIGDIKTPVKYWTPEIREMISTIEEAMVEKFVEENIPAEFKSVFMHRLGEGKDESVEGKILAVADKLDQVYEAFFELKRGNGEDEYVDMYCTALTAIRKIDLKCVDYLLEVILMEMIEEELIANVDIKAITKEVIGVE
jgi:putative hydrolase of HD superfamily